MRDQNGRFRKGNKPATTGQRQYVLCINCKKQIRSFPSRPAKFCSHNCQMKYRWARHMPHPLLNDGHLRMSAGDRDYLHRMIWKKHNGPIPKGMIVHHKNFNKLDNRIKNLMLITKQEHIKIHAQERRRLKSERDNV